MLHDAGLYSPSYAMMCVGTVSDQPLPPAVLAKLDDALRCGGLHTVTALLYDALLVYVMFDEAEPDWQKTVLRADAPAAPHGGRPAVRRRKRATVFPPLHPPGLPSGPPDAVEQTLAGNSTQAFFYQNEDGGRMSGTLVQMHQRIEQLVEKADLGEESIREASATLVELAGRQYSNLRALVSLYAMMLCKKFPCAATQEIDRRSLRPVRQQRGRGVRVPWPPVRGHPACTA